MCKLLTGNGLGKLKKVVAILYGFGIIVARKAGTMESYISRWRIVGAEKDGSVFHVTFWRRAALQFLRRMRADTDCRVLFVRRVGGVTVGRA